MFTSIDSIRFFPCSRGRLGSLASGRMRPDEQYFCWTGLHANAPSAVTISCYLQATTNESNHKDHEAHKGRTNTFCQGHLTQLPYPKVLDNLLIAPGQKAAQMAVEHRLRGADAAYVAVADAFDAALISWDQEMLKRCPAAVATMTPGGWCEDR
jgi:hypothetical protein